MMKRLHEIQMAVSVPKDKRNDFGNYNYRTTEGILAIAKRFLLEGEAITLSDDMVMVGDEMFVKATATLHIDGSEPIYAVSFAMHPKTKKGMDPSQITGSASSYARKYALSGLLAIDDSDGSDDPDASKEPYRPVDQIPQEIVEVIAAINSQATMPDLQTYFVALTTNQRHIAGDPRVIAAKDRRKGELS